MAQSPFTLHMRGLRMPMFSRYTSVSLGVASLDFAICAMSAISLKFGTLRHLGQRLGDGDPGGWKSERKLESSSETTEQGFHLK